MFDLEEIQEEIIIASKVKQLNNSTFKAKNIRQAIAWLRFGPFSGFKLNGSKFGYWNKSNMIYRGQSNSEWPITTSLQRCDDKELSFIATKLFSDLTEMYFNTVLHGDIVTFGLKFEEKFGTAAAQHYGMGTNLLDWTTQPEIAINFANASKEQHKSGKIFLLPVRKALKHGIYISFPPYFIKRIYNQRGIFLDLKDKDIKLLQNDVISIEFDHEDVSIPKTFADLFVMPEENLLPIDKWFRSLKSHCNTRVKEKDFKKNYKMV